MHPIKTINIPEPCHQQWQQMGAVNNGRYCNTCSKTVVDFTAMNNDEVIAYLSTTNNVCGNFSQHQLMQINNALNVESAKSFSWKRLVAAASVAGLFNSTPAIAKPVHKVEQTQPTDKKYLSKNTPADTTTMIIVRGKVVDGKDPIPGVFIKVKGTTIKAETNIEGYFTINVPVTSPVVEFSFIGYQTTEYLVKDIQNRNIVMKLSPSILGDIFVVKRVSWTGRAWHKIKNLF
jgi:hypothetical protein